MRKPLRSYRGSSNQTSNRVLRTAQISLEYLIIVGAAIGLLLPGIYFFYKYSKTNIEGTTNSRLNDLGLQLTSTAKSSYALGNGARQTVNFVMPDNVQEMKSVVVNSGGVLDYELIFTYDTPYGTADAVFYSDVLLVNSTLANGTIVLSPNPGSSKYLVESHTQNVSITEVVS